jgi:hypothetical protein
MVAVALAVAGLAAVAAPAAAQQPGWEVRVPERVEVMAGEAGALPIAIAVDRGLSVSRDAPVIVDLSGAGLGIKKTRLGRADAVDPGADAPRFSVPLRPPAAGDFAVKIRIKLWLCGGRACRPLDVRREARIAVAPAPAPSPAPTPPAPSPAPTPPAPSPAP